MKDEQLAIGDHYWTVIEAQLVEVELVSMTGAAHPMNCVVKDVQQKVQKDKFCIFSWLLHKDPDSAIQQALTSYNAKLQDLEGELDDLMYKLTKIREHQADLLYLWEKH